MAEIAELKARRSGVAEYCQQSLWPQVEELELKYKVDTTAMKSSMVKFGPVAVVGFILMKMAEHQPHASTFKSAVMIAGFVAMAIGGIFILREVAKIARLYAARAAAMNKLAGELKQALVHFIEPSFSFEPSCVFPEQLYKSADIFPNSYDRASAQDRFIGTVGKTKFSATKISTFKEVTSRDSKGNRRTTYVPIYRGLLFEADFNKNFNSKTTVKTDSTEKVIGGLARTAQRLKSTFSKSGLIELENPAFEAVFQVHSTDANEARYILTPAFMERILELKNSRGVDIQLAFQNSKVIVGIPHHPELFQKAFDLQNLSTSANTLVAELFAVLDLVEELDLNNRLSKAS